MFGGDPNVLGKTFVLNGEARTLRRHHAAPVPNLWGRRLATYDAKRWLSETRRGLLAIGRLKAGCGLKTAAAGPYQYCAWPCESLSK